MRVRRALFTALPGAGKSKGELMPPATSRTEPQDCAGLGPGLKPVEADELTRRLPRQERLRGAGDGGGTTSGNGSIR
ncbi:MAG: hypothetical protein QOG75_4762, partial [Mycobacterium sp.]|nr:hypothetical protein [Mycobacterium sp.]